MTISPVPVLGRRSFRGRYLTVWIFLAMAGGDWHPRPVSRRFASTSTLFGTIPAAPSAGAMLRGVKSAIVVRKN